MAIRQERIVLRIDLSGFVSAMSRVTEAMSRLHLTPRGQVRGVDAHHPRPLSIDGAAYHRRRRARARRSR